MVTVKQVVKGEENIDRKKFLDELKRKNEKYGFMRSIEPESNEKDGDLENLPFIVKDAICKEDRITSAGSSIIENYRPVFSSTVVERLEDEGGEYIGKSNQDEFGFGTFCTNCAFETPKNPHDPERVVGGSSGGAGACIAAIDQPLISIGESTGGSVTNPAAYNGVVGITPTYGRVSRHGLINYANSLDKIGVMAEKVYGAAKGLEIIAGEDENDHTTVEGAVPAFSENLDKKESLKIAVPKQYLELEGLEEGVRQNFERSVEIMEEQGFETEEVDIPLLDADYSVPAYYIVAVSEASTNLAKYSGIRYGLEKDPEQFEDFNSYFSEIRSEGFGEEAKRRALLGTYTRQAGYRDQYYIKAAKVRQKLINQLKEVFEQYDVIMAPSMPNIAPKIEEAESMSPEKVYAMDACTVGPNFAGVPMVSVPNGKSEGMPTGLHIIADHFEEQKILDTALTYQEVSDHE